MKIFDIYDDNLGTIKQQLEIEYVWPTFLKSANFEIGEAGRAGLKVWAWPSERKFPIDNSADMIMSSLYFKKTAHQIKEPWLRAEIKSKIDLAMKLAGVEEPPLNPYTISNDAEPELGIALENFAVRVPETKVSDSMKQKYANYFYGDHFVLYPLDSYDNIKTANETFPSLLDEELSVFRPFVAKEIAAQIEDPEELMPNVKAYLPLSKIAAVEDVKTRSLLYPALSDSYEELAEKLEDGRVDNLMKFATELESLDFKEGNPIPLSYDKHVRPAYQYLMGLQQDDQPVSIRVWDDLPALPFSLVEKAASDIEENLHMFKGGLLEDPVECQALVDSLSFEGKKLFYTLARGN